VRSGAVFGWGCCGRVRPGVFPPPSLNVDADPVRKLRPVCPDSTPQSHHQRPPPQLPLLLPAFFVTPVSDGRGPSARIVW
jgi:hypothetical protein